MPSQPLSHGQKPEFTVFFSGQTKSEGLVKNVCEYARVCVCCREVLYLEAVFEFLAHKVEDNGVYAGVYCCKVDTKVIHDQQETVKRKIVFLFLSDR